MSSDVTQNPLKQEKSEEKIKMPNEFLYFGMFFLEMRKLRLISYF